MSQPARRYLATGLPANPGLKFVMADPDKQKLFLLPLPTGVTILNVGCYRQQKAGDLPRQSADPLSLESGVKYKVIL